MIRKYCKVCGLHHAGYSKHRSPNWQLPQHILVPKSYCFVIVLFCFSTLTFLPTSTQVIFLLSTLFFMHDSGLGSATIWVAMAIRETLACKKALHLGDIGKSKACQRHMWGDAKAWGGGEKGELMPRSLTNFHFYPGNPRTRQSMKTVNANLLQIRKVTTACQV